MWMIPDRTRETTSRAAVRSRVMTLLVAGAGAPDLAADCGLAPLMLRRHFTRRWGITPQAYRGRFSQLAG